MDASWLAVFWAALIAFAILVYVLLDGFDLGIGILFGTTRDQNYRGQMLTAIAPFWDGNETWLVIIGASLFGAFPMVYAIFLPAFYLPVALLLLGLIFRGVAFEFRYRTERMRWLWDWGFFLGALIAGFVQGAAIGTMVQELPVVDGRFAGASFVWLTPFSVLCGVGLVLGYALLGATWLVLKTGGPLRDWAYRRVRWLLVGVLAFLVLAFVFAVTRHLRVMDRWLEAPWLLAVPGDRCARGVRPLAGRAKAAGLAPVRDGRRDLRRRLPDLGGQLLALHDPLLGDDLGCRSPAAVARLHVLRRGARGLSGRADLHGRGVLDLPRQGA